MKYAFLGVVLILYGLFLSPAFIAPDDIIISTAYILAANAVLGTALAAIVVPLWIISGYLALVVGLCLIGHFPLRMKHPIAVFVTLGVFAYVIYWFLFIHTPLTFYGG